MNPELVVKRPLAPASYHPNIIPSLGFNPIYRSIFDGGYDVTLILFYENDMIGLPNREGFLF